MSLLPLLVVVILETPSLDHETFLYIGSTNGYRLGETLAVSGDIIAAGSPWDPTYYPTNPAGSVRIFSYTGPGWSLAYTAYPSPPQSGEHAGMYIAVAGERLVVGRPSINTFDGEVMGRRREDGTWLGVPLIAPSLDTKYLGRAVAASGDRLVVSARRDLDYDGRVLFYRWNGPPAGAGIYELVQSIGPPSGLDPDTFGSASAMYGDWTALGAWASDGTLVNSGAIVTYWWRTDIAQWQKMAVIRVPEVLNGGFGMHLALDEDTLVVGCSSPDKGAYVFSRNGASWDFTARLESDDPSRNAWFGYALAVDRNVLVVGDYLEDGPDFMEEDLGAAYVFIRIGDTWVLKYRLAPVAGNAYNFGQSVAVRDNLVFVGAPGAYYEAGRIFVYRIPPEPADIQVLSEPPDITLDNTFGLDLEIRDQYGQPYMSPVTLDLAIYDGPPGAVLSGSLVAVSESGIASFSGLSLDTAGTYSLITAISGIDSVITREFTISLAPEKFVISQPANSTVDSYVTVTIQVQDSSGTLVPNYQLDVTLVLSGSAFGGGLVDVVDGTVSVQIRDHVSETVTLRLQDSENTGLDISSVRSVSFLVGAANKLVFVNQPTAVKTGSVFVPPVSVRLTDQYGNFRGDSGIWITQVLLPNPQNASVTGTSSVQTLNGVSAFSNLGIDKPGSFSLQAMSGSLQAATSTPFTVTEPDPEPPAPSGSDSEGCVPGSFPTSSFPTGFSFPIFVLIFLALTVKYSRKA